MDYGTYLNAIEEENGKKMKEIIKIAEEIATKAHEGQSRWNGEPYIIHPRRVADSLDKPEHKIVGLLHDVIEDTSVTFHDLIDRGIPPKLVKAILAMTKRENENYFDFIMRIRQHSIAKAVKIADIEDNLNDNLNEGSLKDKYRLARYILKNR